MEESINKAFELKELDPLTVSSLSLAYLGDAVYELVIRHALLAQKGARSGALYHLSLPFVSAVGQAKMAEGIRPLLSEEEEAVFRRGKNAKPEHFAKNASEREYHLATGLEALVGYLYLQGRIERALELIKAGMPYAGNIED